MPRSVIINLLFLASICISVAQQLSSGTSHASFLDRSLSIVTIPPNEAAFPTPKGPFVQVEAGHGYSCGLRANGTLQCWSVQGPTADEPAMRNLTARGPYQQISAGWRTLGALTVSGFAECWGGLPKSIVPLTRFSMISCGWLTCCGLRSSDSGVSCFGSIDLGFRVSGPFVFVSVRVSSVCAIRADGALVCVGPPSEVPRFSPPIYSHFSTGQDYACAVSGVTQQALCAGGNDLGQSSLLHLC
jgi:hypothetical protein